jgi:Bacterial regulatory proteins, luxR family
LDLSVITVKVHRATMMRKMRCRRLVDLVRAADALEGVGSLLLPFGTRRRQLLESKSSFSCPPPYADQHQVCHLSL